MTLEQSREPVGFIGLGVMGLPMARNLVQGGHHVVAFNRTPQRVLELAQLGVLAADTPADVARRAEIVITMVTDAAAVEQVLFGPSGAINGLRPGSIVIDTSSISPIATRDFGARLAKVGVTLLDAPVSGGQTGAVNGTLSFMVGGDTAALERCRPVFEAMGSRITWIGASGAGQIAKACNQAIVAVSLVGICEALLLAARSGVDPGRVREALLGGAAGGPVLEGQGKRIIERSFEPGFRAALHYKDIGIAHELGKAVGSPVPATSLALDLFGSLLASGLGDADHSAIVTVLEGIAGSTVTDPTLSEPTAVTGHG